MNKLRKLSRLLDALEDKGVDAADVVVDPKAVHIVTSEDDSDEDE